MFRTVFLWVLSLASSGHLQKKKKKKKSFSFPFAFCVCVIFSGVCRDVLSHRLMCLTCDLSQCLVFAQPLAALLHRVAALLATMRLHRLRQQAPMVVVVVVVVVAMVVVALVVVLVPVAACRRVAMAAIRSTAFSSRV
jgi:Na+/glutamate symporter